MVNTKIRDYKGDIILQIEKLNSLNKELNISNEFNTIYDQTIELLGRIEPSLMFYGIYNSGKSSLLNAIFGEMKASVADIPETHQITYYRWRNFDLVDTPGVNGPIEDFVISKPELKKHNVIMFVIDDSDNFDSAFVAEEIVEIISAGKPLIIVLNNKQDSAEERFNLIRNKLYKNISQAAQLQGISNIEQKYEFIVINANMAYKGKTENKQLLLKNSKIEELEIMITEQLRLIDEIKILLNPIEIILNSTQELTKLLKQEMAENEQKHFVKLLREIVDKKNYTITNLQSVIRMDLRRYNELIYSLVIAGNDIDNLQHELSDKINQHINNAVQAFSSECNIQFTTLINNPELQLVINKFSTDATDISFKDKINSVPREGSGGSLDILLDVISTIPILPIPMPLPTPIPVPAIVAIVKGIMSIFKDEKDRDIEGIQAELEMNNIRQREAINRRMNAMQETRTQINIQMYKYEEEALKIATENIMSVHNQTIQQINTLMNLADQKAQRFILASESIDKIEMELFSIRNELKQ